VSPDRLGKIIRAATGVGSAAGAVRRPAVAGAFYPADPAQLTAMIDRLLDAVAVPAGDRLAAGYVVPHAGYRYSGGTAAHVYARLRHHAAGVARVLLIGPAHRVPLRGCAVPTTDRWRTPLGEVDVDPLARDLASAGRAVADDAPHAPEHSLEVQVPFLQRVLPGVPIVPVVAGVSETRDVAALLAAGSAAGAGATAGGGTVVLCSTDLSHYLTDERARQQDARTAAAIEALRPDLVGVRDACGVYALRGTLAWAAGRGLAVRRLALTTSAESGGDRGRVVGYPAFAFAAPAPSPGVAVPDLDE
jgi:MEMO1 family protein